MRMRHYLAKTLILPIIDLYDFIYGTAMCMSLHHLNVAYNDLMRSVVGVRRTTHMRISELRELTGFDELAVRRNNSLLKFITGVVNQTVFSHIHLQCIHLQHGYSMRSRRYVVPRFSSNVGKLRISVRGLKLLNCI